jgi:hypothetical protein
MLTEWPMPEPVVQHVLQDLTPFLSPQRHTYEAVPPRLLMMSELAAIKQRVGCDRLDQSALTTLMSSAEEGFYQAAMIFSAFRDRRQLLGEIMELRRRLNIFIPE